MTSVSRRGFVRSAGVAVTGMALSRLSGTFAPLAPRLSFSTLGCPTWPLKDILTFAVANGYQGIELRGLLSEMDLTRCPEFSSANLAATKRAITESGVAIVNLGASTELHEADSQKRLAGLDEGRRYIDLAHELDCPHIRVFPNALPPDRDRDATFALISDGLAELSKHATGSRVDVLMETHGGVVATADVLRVMRASAGPKVGLVWDVCNMWSVTKESPAHVYAQLKPYVRHTHIKDLTLSGHDVHYVLLGKGEAPIAEALRALAGGGYSGYYSFEWEKRWHPEIEEPAIAISHYAKEVVKYL